MREVPRERRGNHHPAEKKRRGGGKKKKDRRMEMGGEKMSGEIGEMVRRKCKKR